MKDYFKNAFKELKDARSLTGAALFGAMGPILDMLTITVNDFLKISFTSLTHAATGYMYGPVMGMLAGGIFDIVKYMIKPTGAFFPGFTVNEMAVGLVYGLFFYNRKVTLPRVIGARIIVTFGINLTLTPLWLSIMYGNAFKFMVPARLIKNLVMIPIDIFILYTLLKFMEKHIKPIAKGKRQ